MHDGITVYLSEIGKVPLLTPQEEIDLAARVKKGDREAWELMINANLRLVVAIAHQFAGLGLPILDIVSEGNIGLMRAAERFDPEKGKFSAYAGLCIKRTILRALSNQSKTVRLPVFLVDRISRMRRVSSQLSRELEREPTDDELAEELGISSGKVSQLKTISIRPASLDAPISDDDPGSALGEIVADERAQTPYESLSEKDLRDELRGCLLAVLTERERTIISRRFGLDDCEPATLEELGRVFGISRERVRQIEEVALVRLRRALAEREMPRFNGHRLPQRCR
jgi:RNA polymerase primary sigma factor